MGNEYLEKYISENLKGLQAKELSILKEIDALCKKHGIEYWLDGGTCLGAVRHKGFIPWDDDIDIAMRLEDLPRFIEFAQKELPRNLFVQTRESDPTSRLPITKVRDLNSFYVEFRDDFSRPYQKGIFVDIFPFVKYPSANVKLMKRTILAICRSHAILTVQHYYSLRSFAEFFYFGAKYLVNLLIWNSLCLTCKKDKYYGNVLKNNGYGIVHRYDSVFPTSEVEFEGFQFNAPNNPNAYLKDLYNNYMQLPPVEKRKAHSIFFEDELIKDMSKDAER
jgi:lipopolysaccharide cholinephosphotransferase